MTPIAIVTLTLAWGELRDVRDLDARAAIASAIVAVTDDEHEQRTLARLAWTEARFSMRVATCRVVGSRGGRGVWQVVARDRREAGSVCGPLEGQAALALERVRESREVDGTLRTYVCGNRRSANCNWLAREREK